MNIRVAAWAVCLGALGFVGAAYGQLDWVAPSAVNSDYRSDERTDSYIEGGPQVAGDGKGTWVVVWEGEPAFGSDQMPLGPDYDLYFSRSINDGTTWSAIAALNTDAAVDAIDNASPSLATDGEGNWVVVWWEGETLGGPTRQLRSARSSDNGATWSAPSATLTTDARQGALVATDRRGTWITVWATLAGDVKYARSLDNGATWSPDEDLSSNVGASNRAVSVATDRAGNWICAFESLDNNHQENAPGWDIFYNVSSDNGDTWGSTFVLNSNSGVPDVDDNEPKIVTDGRGAWIAVWHSDPPGFKGTPSQTDSEILVARSTNRGLSWSFAEPLNTDANTDTNTDAFPSLTTDGFGNLVAVWQDLGAIALDSAVSRDNGLTWSESVFVYDELNGNPHVTTDEKGNWLTVWPTFRNPDEPLQSDTDVYVSKADFTATLTGVVREAGTDSPLSCATVRIIPNDGGLERIVTTDVNGVYRALNVPEGAYSLMTYSPGFATVTLNNVNVSGDTTYRAITLSPVLQIGGVRGRVTDAATGEPLFGVRVEARINDALVATTYTCGEGNYGMFNLVAKTTEDVELEFTAENFDSETRNVMVESGLTTETDVAMMKSVAAPGSLTGVVMSEAGNAPLPGARVTVSGQANLSADADGAGIYLFAALPEGQYTVEASAEGHIGAVTVKTVPATAIESQDFVLPPGEDGAIPGDVNGDNEVDAVDIQLVINQALGLPGSGDADLNDDGTVDAVDVQLIINIVLGVA